MCVGTLILLHETPLRFLAMVFHANHVSVQFSSIMVQLKVS